MDEQKLIPYITDKIIYFHPDESRTIPIHASEINALRRDVSVRLEFPGLQLHESRVKNDTMHDISIHSGSQLIIEDKKDTVYQDSSRLFTNEIWDKIRQFALRNGIPYRVFVEPWPYDTAFRLNEIFIWNKQGEKVIKNPFPDEEEKLFMSLYKEDRSVPGNTDQVWLFNYDLISSLDLFPVKTRALIKELFTEELVPSGEEIKRILNIESTKEVKHDC